MNMHLLIHLSDQIKEFGALPYCSMFVFERQFLNFKTFCQGNTDYLNQVSKKVMLLKHCKNFLYSCKIEKKEEILRLLSLNIDVPSDKYIYHNESRVSKGDMNYYSLMYSQNKTQFSCVYQVLFESFSKFGFIKEFFQDDHSRIFAKVNLLTYQPSQLFNFDNINVPLDVKSVVNKHSDIFYTCKKSNTTVDVPIESVLNPCVYVDMSAVLKEPLLLVMPCISLIENL